MSGSGRIAGWALPAGLTPRETGTLPLAEGVEIEWPDFDGVSALRLVETLRESSRALAARPAGEIAEALGAVGARFADPGDPLRTEAVRHVASESGLSPEMADRVVAGMARDWTADRLRRLLAEEFGTPSPLDGFVLRGGRRIAAFGDAFTLHIASGSVPGVGATSLIRSLLVKSPVLLKPGAGDVALSVAWVRALREVDPELADACAVAYWPGGSAEAEGVFLARADRVVVYGGDATIRAVRAGAAPGAPIVEYGHRVGFSVVGPDEFDAEAVAHAVGTFDQRGCVTTHQLFVLGGRDRAEEVAEQVAEALDRFGARLPRGRLAPGEASTLRQSLETRELQAAAGSGGWFAGGVREGWAVAVDDDPGMRPGPGARSVRVVPAGSIPQIAADLGRMRLHLQTAGYGGFADPDRVVELANALGRVGVTRIVPFASVAFPPAWWYHDGRGPLEALVRRVELESESP